MTARVLLVVAIWAITIFLSSFLYLFRMSPAVTHIPGEGQLTVVLVLELIAGALIVVAGFGTWLILTRRDEQQ